MSVINLTTENFDEEVLLSDKTVLVDFFAVWCGPCRMVSPVVDEIADEREDIKVCKVNVDEQPGLAERFSVSSIPALMVFKDGKAVRSEVGAMPKQEILSML
ncbi:MAG: thioredoxin [Acutalibacteraceae bacterium]|nr:thioredoxin [Acutalibacteraceae bacterium]